MSLQLKKSRIANGKGQNITYDTKVELCFFVHKHCPQVGGGFFFYESCITCAIFSFLPTPPSPLPRRFSRVLLTESTNSFKLCALPEVTIPSVIKNYICTQKLIPKIAKSQCRRVTLVSNRSGTVKQNLQSHTPQSSQDLLFT